MCLAIIHSFKFLFVPFVIVYPSLPIDHTLSYKLNYSPKSHQEKIHSRKKEPIMKQHFLPTAEGLKLEAVKAQFSPRRRIFSRGKKAANISVSHLHLLVDSKYCNLTVKDENVRWMHMFMLVNCTGRVFRCTHRTGDT